MADDSIDPDMIAGFLDEADACLRALNDDLLDIEGTVQQGNTIERERVRYHVSRSPLAKRRCGVPGPAGDYANHPSDRKPLR